MTKPKAEVFLESLLFRSRWLMAPFYFGLVIALLLAFMHLSRGEGVDTTHLDWLVVIHLTFVVSGVLLALTGWPAAKVDRR